MAFRTVPIEVPSAVLTFPDGRKYRLREMSETRENEYVELARLQREAQMASATLEFPPAGLAEDERRSWKTDDSDDGKTERQAAYEALMQAALSLFRFLLSDPVEKTPPADDAWLTTTVVVPLTASDQVLRAQNELNNPADGAMLGGYLAFVRRRLA